MGCCCDPFTTSDCCLFRLVRRSAIKGCWVRAPKWVSVMSFLSLVLGIVSTATTGWSKIESVESGLFQSCFGSFCVSISGAAVRWYFHVARAGMIIGIITMFFGFVIAVGIAREKMERVCNWNKYAFGYIYSQGGCMFGLAFIMYLIGQITDMDGKFYGHYSLFLALGAAVFGNLCAPAMFLWRLHHQLKESAPKASGNVTA